MPIKEITICLSATLRKIISQDEEGYSVVYESQDQSVLPWIWKEVDIQHIASNASDALFFREVSSLFPLIDESEVI